MCPGSVALEHPHRRWSVLKATTHLQPCSSRLSPSTIGSSQRLLSARIPDQSTDLADGHTAEHILDLGARSQNITELIELCHEPGEVPTLVRILGVLQDVWEPALAVGIPTGLLPDARSLVLREQAVPFASMDTDAPSRLEGSDLSWCRGNDGACFSSQPVIGERAQS